VDITSERTAGFADVLKERSDGDVRVLGNGSIVFSMERHVATLAGSGYTVAHRCLLRQAPGAVLITRSAPLPDVTPLPPERALIAANETNRTDNLFANTIVDLNSGTVERTVTLPSPEIAVFSAALGALLDVLDDGFPMFSRHAAQAGSSAGGGAALRA